MYCTEGNVSAHTISKALGIKFDTAQRMMELLTKHWKKDTIIDVAAPEEPHTPLFVSAIGKMKAAEAAAQKLFDELPDRYKRAVSECFEAHPRSSLYLGHAATHWMSEQRSKSKQPKSK